MIKAGFKQICVLIFWMAVWELLSIAVGKALLLPGPMQVFLRLLELMQSRRFWFTTAVSLLRILCGILSGLVFGTLLAVLTSRSVLLDTLFAPLLTVVKATPVASFIILALIWLGRDILPGFIAVLIILPVVWANVSNGIAQTDKKLLEMAAVFRFSPIKTIRYIYLPSVLPHFLAACRAALGLGWKAGIAAEVLTVPSISMGKMLYESKLYLEITDLFAWTAAVVLCSLLIEQVLMSTLLNLGRKSAGKAVKS